MKNKVSLLGFLGLLGLVGSVVDNPGFYGSFGFFGFSKILPDEMFKANFDRAARNGFISGVAVYPIAVTWGAFTSFAHAYALGFAISFAVQILVFVISLSVYERRGER